MLNIDDSKNTMTGKEMGTSIAYGIILEKKDHDKILKRILTALPVEEQRFVYLDIYADEYSAYPASEKLEVDALDIESPEFKETAFATLADRDAIYYLIDEKYSLLSVRTLQHGEVTSIIISDSHQFLDEYGPITQRTFSNEDMEQLTAALSELELDLTPQWFYWSY